MAWQRGHGMALVWGEQRSSSGGPGSEVPVGFAVGLPTAWAGGSCNPPATTGECSTCAPGCPISAQLCSLWSALSTLSFPFITQRVVRLWHCPSERCERPSLEVPHATDGPWAT